MESTGAFLIATPLKALLDYIYVHNKNYDSVNAIEEDLRLNWDNFIEYKEYVNKEKLEELLVIDSGEKIKNDEEEDEL